MSVNNSGRHKRLFLNKADELVWNVGQQYRDQLRTLAHIPPDVNTDELFSVMALFNLG